MTAPGHPTAGYQLLARACGDAIEHDRQNLTLYAPPGHPLHRLVCASGGTIHHQEADEGDVFMVRIINPIKFLAALAPEFEARARTARLPRETELGLSIDEVRCRLIYTRRGFRVRPDKLGRSYLTLSRSEFTRMALGHSSAHEALATGRIESSTQTALETAHHLFPLLQRWRPPWDDLPTP